MNIVLTWKEKIDMYFGVGAIGILFLFVFLFWLIKKEKSRQSKVFVAYLLIAVVAMSNPLSLYVIEKTGNMEVYERFFWLLMTTFLLAFSFALFVQKEKRLLIPVLVLLLLTGKSVFTNIEYKPAENKEKISKQAIEVSEIIMRDFEGLTAEQEVVPNRRNIEMPKAIVTEPLNEAIRMYNANIDLWYVRKNFGNYDKKGYRKMAALMTLENEEISVRRVISNMKKKRFEYLVIGDWQTLVGDTEKYHLNLIGKTKNYSVYKYQPEKKYIMIQYADPNDYQAMSYLIYNAQGGLIVVDGGRAWQSETLIKSIKNRGGVVDAWIITHAHDDHAGVLASVLEAEWHKSKIEIKEILIGDMDYEAVMAQGSERIDMIGYLQMGLEKHENVRVLKAGDELDVIGLHMKVLHTCNQTVVENSDNILNDGSMVFTLQGEKRRVMFLADTADNSRLTAEEITDPSQGSKIGRLIADEILANYPEDVKCWAVQMSHHGNGSYPDYFYEAIAPKRAFFDAPDWLMNNRNKESGQESYYSTPHYVELMERLGAKIISYDSPAQRVKFR